VTFTGAFEEHEAIQRGRVMSETFGHLAPKTDRAYSGTILFIHGEYGDDVPLRVDFPDLPDSPWFFEGMCDFILDHGDDGDHESGKVFRWTGLYSFEANEDGETTHTFDGETVEVRLS
jgi:hypothetical protein